MIDRPLLLCPIDFSTASLGALRVAVAIAERFDTRLIMLRVDDPLLAEVADTKRGSGWGRLNSERELRRFLAETLGPDAAPKLQAHVEVVIGKPAVEILRVARERACDLIVMSTHGRSGAQKMFFGSTAEGVLRGTTVPVLLTPADDTGPVTIDALTHRAAHVLVPVDFSTATTHLVQVAQKVAAALRLPMLFAHVIAPLPGPVPLELNVHELTAERMSRAQAALDAIGAATPATTPSDTLIVEGNPAEQIARLARERHAGLIVLGLHGSPFPGPRMGSVTYRVLCLAPVLTLALPPEPVPGPSGPGSGTVAQEADRRLRLALDQAKGK